MFARIFRTRSKQTLYAVLRRSTHLFLVVEWSAKNDTVQPLKAFASCHLKENGMPRIACVYSYLGKTVDVEYSDLPLSSAVKYAEKTSVGYR